MAAKAAVFPVDDVRADAKGGVRALAPVRWRRCCVACRGGRRRRARVGVTKGSPLPAAKGRVEAAGGHAEAAPSQMPPPSSSDRPCGTHHHHPSLSFPNAPQGTQGAVIPYHPISGPCAWRAADYPSPDSYAVALTETDVAELRAATRAALAATGGRVEAITLAHVGAALPTLGPKLVAVRDDVVAGKGFALLRGFPTAEAPDWTRAHVVAGYWILGLHWGAARPNNKKGHLVGHIKDLGHDPALPTTRLYATAAAQPWHNDSADLVSLLALAPAARGGLSRWASSIAIYNELLATRPDDAAVLAARSAWYYDRKGEVPAGKEGYFEMPILNFSRGFLSVNISSNYYRDSQRFPDVPRLTAAQLAAVAAFEALADDPRFFLEHALEPGDIQLLNNHNVLHTRSAFENDATHARHLLRLWLAPPVERPLPPVYKELYGGSVAVGARGGIRIDGVTLKVEDLYVPLNAED